MYRWLQSHLATAGLERIFLSWLCTQSCWEALTKSQGAELKGALPTESAIALRAPYSTAPREMKGDSTEAGAACWEMLPFGFDMTIGFMSTHQP